MNQQQQYIPTTTTTLQTRDNTREQGSKPKGTRLLESRGEKYPIMK
jgi:hypothetical protein